MNAFQAQPWRESFSTREIEVLQLISRGASNREIAQKLHLSIETVKWYNKQMFSKLGVNNRIQAVNKAAELALLSSEQAIKSQKKPAEAGNLPAQLTSYVGREKEIKEIKELLKHNRLVMLTGVGGAGKTRLALKVGEELNGRYPDGVWMVELANLRDPSLVIQTIANVLHISKRTDPDSTLQELLSRYLRRRHLLLLIDNLEHVLECAPLIGELLAAAPQLSVIGTSRERLHLYGEQEYPVHPLNLPESLDNMTSDDLKNVESINLFIKRAQSIDPSISFDMDELKGVARICASLDGLPLAIELCAPMLKMFPPGEIADRIETSLDVIPGGPRDLPARHQTLDNTIQWSFNLLEESEKRLLERLSIFNGDATLEVIESICGGELPGNIVDLLSALVNKNLVLAQERQDGEIYFRLLETVRQFSYQKLLLSNQAERFAKRHAKTF
ncbi:MAG: AAA family ATPase, partial [Gammaproteobacteria bacterium]|nr:AAA family ATPase [Gammaproteobacteria bacterium]